MYTEIYLRLEPLGVELVAAAARQAGHQVRILDLQVFSHADYFRALEDWAPDVVTFGVNYLANIPEVVDLGQGDAPPAARGAFRRRRAQRFVHRGGDPGARRRGHRLRHPGGGRGDLPARAGGGAGRRRADRAAGPPDRGRRRSAAPDGARSERARAGARSAAAPAKIFHRRARSGGVDRVLARVPVGLLVLQRLDVLRPHPPAARSRAHRRRAGTDRRARGVHRRRRGLHSRGARVRHRTRDRAAQDPQEVLPGDARGRPAAEPRGVPLLEAPRARVHVPGRRGGRRGGAEGAPQAGQAVAELRGAGDGPLAGRHGGHQHHRRHRLGRRTVPRHPRVGAVDPRDREHQRQHALSGHRDVPRTGTPAGDARLPAVRHPARGHADAAAARALLRRAGQDPAGAEHEAPGPLGAQGHGGAGRQAAGPRTDELRAHALAVQQRVQPAAADRRPSATGALPDAPAAAPQARRRAPPPRSLRAAPGAGPDGAPG